MKPQHLSVPPKILIEPLFDKSISLWVYLFQMKRAMDSDV